MKMQNIQVNLEVLFFIFSQNNLKHSNQTLINVITRKIDMRRSRLQREFYNNITLYMLIGFGYLKNKKNL